MLRIRIRPHDRILCAAGPVRLIDLLDEAPGKEGVPLSCRAGHCGVCRVTVEHGASALEPASCAEAEVLDALEAGPEERLACQLRIRWEASAETDVVLHLRPSSQTVQK